MIDALPIGLIEKRTIMTIELEDVNTTKIPRDHVKFSDNQSQQSVGSKTIVTSNLMMYLGLDGESPCEKNAMTFSGQIQYKIVDFQQIEELQQIRTTAEEAIMKKIDLKGVEILNIPLHVITTNMNMKGVGQCKEEVEAKITIPMKRTKIVMNMMDMVAALK
jgi:hypothetical protein